MPGIRFAALIALGLVAWMACVAVADEPQPPPECYDAIISAEIAAQIPSVLPGCDDCIIVRWPWFVDLKIRRVIEGRVRERLITVLTMQHADLRDDIGAKRWWLRRNATGGFNVVRFARGDGIARCPGGVPAAEPHLRPGDGETLDDLRERGARHYGRETSKTPNAR
jgi:hypothetical protein